MRGVVLALVTPTRPRANLRPLLAQAQAVIDTDALFRGEAVTRTCLPAAMLRALDTVHDRIESPLSKLHRAVEPWSSMTSLCLRLLVLRSGMPVSNGRVTSFQDTSDSSWLPCSPSSWGTVGDL